MKTLVIGLMLLAGQAKADWHGFSLPDSQVLSIHPIAVRGYINGQWLAGYGKDLFFYQIPGTVNGKPLPRVYFALNHLYNTAELFSSPKKVTGVFGPAVGMEIGGLASKVQGIVNFGINFVHDTGGPVLEAPPWLVDDLDKWVSIETGGGYRLAGSMPDVKPWEAWVGGRVKITFDLKAHH